MRDMLEILPLRRAGKERRQLRLLQPEQIRPNPNQPRRHFDSQAIESLAESIRQYGLINPLTVRSTGEGYELIAGERRLRACQTAGLQQIPCYIVASTEQDSSLMALVENLQRQDLDFYEEALGIARLMQNHGMTQQQAAQSLGKTQSAVANKLRLLKLPMEAIDLLRQNQMTERHARALLKLETPEQPSVSNAPVRQTASEAPPVLEEPQEPLPIERRVPLERLGTEVLKLSEAESGQEILRLERAASGVNLMMLFCNMTAAERAEWKRRRTEAYSQRKSLLSDSGTQPPPPNDLP